MNGNSSNQKSNVPWWWTIVSAVIGIVTGHFGFPIILPTPQPAPQPTPAVVPSAPAR